LQINSAIKSLIKVEMFPCRGPYGHKRRGTRAEWQTSWLAAREADPVGGIEPRWPHQPRLNFSRFTCNTAATTVYLAAAEVCLSRLNQHDTR